MIPIFLAFLLVSAPTAQEHTFRKTGETFELKATILDWQDGEGGYLSGYVANTSATDFVFFFTGRATDEPDTIPKVTFVAPGAVRRLLLHGMPTETLRVCVGSSEPRWYDWDAYERISAAEAELAYLNPCAFTDGESVTIAFPAAIRDAWEQRRDIQELVRKLQEYDQATATEAEARAALKEERERARRLQEKLRSVPVYDLVGDDDFKVRYLNPSAARKQAIAASVLHVQPEGGRLTQVRGTELADYCSMLDFASRYDDETRVQALQTIQVQQLLSKETAIANEAVVTQCIMAHWPNDPGNYQRCIDQFESPDPWMTFVIENLPTCNDELERNRTQRQPPMPGYRADIQRFRAQQKAIPK